MGAAIRGRAAAAFANAKTNGSDAIATSLSSTVIANGPDDALRDFARYMSAARRGLAMHLDGSLFANPGLDILLFLFAEGVNGATVTTNACCAAAGVPRTTALRWVKLLQDRGLIDGSDDITDRRVTMLALTDRARDILRHWLTEVTAMQKALPRQVEQ